MLNESYALSVARLPGLMEAIQNAGVPSKFTHEFLKSLGFKSTNDRTFISMLKGIGFLDDAGTPTDRYKAYKNKSSAKGTLAQALRNNYEDLFLANEKAQELSIEKLKGIFATKTGKGDAVVSKMASTFKALAALADFSEAQPSPPPAEEKPIESQKHKLEGYGPRPEFHYNIQIHLPITKDIAVYNAIFKSINEHLT